MPTVPPRARAMTGHPVHPPKSIQEVESLKQLRTDKRKGWGLQSPMVPDNSSEEGTTESSLVIRLTVHS